MRTLLAMTLIGCGGGVPTAVASHADVAVDDAMTAGHVSARTDDGSPSLGFVRPPCDAGVFSGHQKMCPEGLVCAGDAIGGVYTACVLPSYSVGDGIVTDSATGLEWMAAVAADTSFTQAESYCRTLGGGWRVPDAWQLWSIVLPGSASPLNDHAVFSPTANGYVWASVPAHWTVNFDDGSLGDNSGGVPSLVRCVHD